VLSQLKDKDRKRRVLQFLREARLISSKELHILEGQPIHPNIVGLEDADLRDANLSGMKLEDTNLNGADLSSANLSGANLKGANLSGANLSGAKLPDAELQKADLSFADLHHAELPRPTAVTMALEMEWLDEARDKGNLNEATWRMLPSRKQT
jgi:uncharacterized protein YjbI with pentapeptide repeats